MLYTAVPIEWILEDEDEEEKKNRREVDINGVKLVLEQSGSDTYQIVKIISTDPSHYLDDNYQPGKTLTLKPLL